MILMTWMTNRSSLQRRDRLTQRLPTSLLAFRNATPTTWNYRTLWSTITTWAVAFHHPKSTIWKSLITWTIWTTSTGTPSIGRGLQMETSWSTSGLNRTKTSHPKRKANRPNQKSSPSISSFDAADIWETSIFFIFLVRGRVDWHKHFLSEFHYWYLAILFLIFLIEEKRTYFLTNFVDTRRSHTFLSI